MNSNEPVQCGKCLSIRFDNVFPVGGTCDYIIDHEACEGTWRELPRGRDTGFRDRFGRRICEGDYVVTRERHWRFRWLSFHYGHMMPRRIHEWFGGLGRKNGRTWLGIVTEDRTVGHRQGAQPCECEAHWKFVSVNQSATIWEYWASQLEIVFLPIVKNVG